MNIRRSHERGRAKYGWLDSYHTFSFGSYYDPEHMGFRALRVINDDRVTGGRGFGAHPHRDMEILSYVVEGALEHRDSMGNGSVIRPGDVQRMRAGTGVTHSEYNHSKTDSLRFLQLWVLPDRSGLEPGYAQKYFGDERRGAFRLVASPDGAEGSVQIAQDMRMYASVLADEERVVHSLAVGRHAWLQMVRGNLVVNGIELGEGDGVSFDEATDIQVASSGDSELILFDLA